jgi:Protein of unknown function (DUF1573)
MRIFLIILSAGLFFACNNGDKKASAINATVQPASVTTIQWLDSMREVGEVIEGEKVETQFRFINTGKSPLVVSNVEASCGCTVPEKPTEPIMPGEEGRIKAVFDSKGRPGRNIKQLRVRQHARAYAHRHILR